MGDPETHFHLRAMRTHVQFLILSACEDDKLNFEVALVQLAHLAGFKDAAKLIGTPCPASLQALAEQASALLRAT